MQFIRFPIRLENGLLKRSEEADALVALVQTMARTPKGSWSALPCFGLRDFLEDARRRPGSLQAVAVQVNSALEELGITHYRVEAVTREAPADRDVDAYTLALVPMDGGKGRAFDLAS